MTQLVSYSVSWPSKEVCPWKKVPWRLSWMHHLPIDGFDFPAVFSTCPRCHMILVLNVVVSSPPIVAYFGPISRWIRAPLWDWTHFFLKKIIWFKLWCICCYHLTVMVSFYTSHPCIRYFGFNCPIEIEFHITWRRCSDFRWSRGASNCAEISVSLWCPIYDMDKVWTWILPTQSKRKQKRVKHPIQ